MTSLADELAHAYAPGDTEEERARFRLTSDDQAQWALRKYAQASEAIAAIRQQADTERERIDAWESREQMPLDRERDYFHFLLVEYAEACRADGRKSVSLSTGKIGTRDGSLSWRVEDPDAFLAWAREHHPDLIQVTEKPAAVADLKAALKSTEDLEPGQVAEAVDPNTGAIVPGVAVKRGPVTVTVSPA